MSNNDISITRDTKTGRKKTWLVRWWGKYDPSTGKQARSGKSFATKKEAQKFKEELRKQHETGLLLDRKDVTLGELCEIFINDRKDRFQYSTLVGYRDTINELLKYFSPSVSIKRILPEHAQQFSNSRKLVNWSHIRKGKKLSDSAKNKHLRQSKTIFTLAVELGFLVKNPFRNIKQRRVRKEHWHYINPSEFKSILQKTESLSTRTFYAVMYGCGLRFGEAVNLLWNGTNIDFEHSIISIRNRKGTKNIPPFFVKDYEDRTLPMPKWVSDMLIELQMKLTEQCPFLFLTKKRYEMVKKKWQRFIMEGREAEWQNKHLTDNALRDFKRTCRAAGIKTNEKLTIHCLRKSYACNLANSGKVPAHTLLELMGHSDIKTCSEYYLKTISANKKKAVEILEEIMEEQQV